MTGDEHVFYLHGPFSKFSQGASVKDVSRGGLK